MSIMSLFSSISAKAKAAISRIAALVGIGEAAEVAHMVTAANAPAIQFVPQPRRRRSPGPVRPAGSKLARKAAEGTVGKAVIR